MNYLTSRRLPEPAYLLDPPEAFLADVSVEETDDFLDREQLLIDLHLDSLPD